MEKPDAQLITIDQWVTQSEAARRTGVNRRTIHRWLNGGKIRTNKRGEIQLSAVLKQLGGRGPGQSGRRPVGRPPKGIPHGDHPMYWEIAGTHDWERARDFFVQQKRTDKQKRTDQQKGTDSQEGLIRLKRMLACLAHDWAVQGKGPSLIATLSGAVELAEKIVRQRKDGEAVWKVQARRLLKKHPTPAENPIANTGES